MDASFIGLFIEGLLSFLSPCVLPLIPLYMAYLSSGSKKEVDGEIKYENHKVFLMTIFFVLGISLTFVIFALSINLISDFLNDYKEVISIIGGTIIIFFALHEIGVINISFLNTEARFKINLHLEKMNFLKAFLFGFVFSFAWTPCIGPMLTSALLMAAVGDGVNYLYLVAYGLGLIVPFLITGLFTSFILNLLTKYQKIFKYVIKIAGVIMLGFGIYMIYNAASDITSQKNIPVSETLDSNKAYILNYDFYDQNGNTINLYNEKGNYLLLNYIATWCTYCRQEIPEYLSYCKDSEDSCYYVMSPRYNQEDVSSIYEFIDEYNIDIPVIIDEEGVLFLDAGINSFPTLVVIGPDSSYVGYISGYLGVDNLQIIVSKAHELYEDKLN